MIPTEEQIEASRALVRKHYAPMGRSRRARRAVIRQLRQDIRATKWVHKFGPAAPWEHPLGTFEPWRVRLVLNLLREELARQRKASR